MSVCPIDYGRYGSREIRSIFSEEVRLQKMLDVEAALAKALAEVKEIPVEAAETIVSKANTRIVTVEKVREKEKETKHDVMAMVEVLAEECGKHGEYVHWGATSYDIVDTSWALLLKDSLKIIEDRLKDLIDVLSQLVIKYIDVVMAGRTHGQHAAPITLGFKFAVYLAEFKRNMDRLNELKKRVLVGKMSGAVGTMASFGDKGIEVQRRVMEKLGLEPAEISTQIVCRDRLAELILWIALTGSSLDRVATEIRNLQRTEIMEVAEGFKVGEQVGSSTMPHKQNPIGCEKISGLAKLLRGLVIPSLENIALWHERDLTNSSNERFMIPISIIVLEEMLRTMTKVLRELRVYSEKMKSNLEASRGMIMSEAVMMALARKGMGRQSAHRLLRELSIKTLAEGKNLRDVLIENELVRKYLTVEEINELMDPAKYLGKSKEVALRIVEDVKEHLSKQR